MLNISTKSKAYRGIRRIILIVIAIICVSLILQVYLSVLLNADIKSRNSHSLLHTDGFYCSSSKCESILYLSNSNGKTTLDEIIFKHFESYKLFDEFPVIDSTSTQFSRIAQIQSSEMLIDQSPRSDMLIVLTTCNQLNMTLLTLEYLRNSFTDADLVIIDDHSIDGTPVYLLKRGFHVITKSTATGLTASWNLGYHLGMLLGYQYIAFCNNDILIPSGSLSIIKQELRSHAFVIPLTTRLGAGHNPLQNLFVQHKIDNRFDNYINSPRHASTIQKVLSQKYKDVLSSNESSMTISNSIFKGEPRFNGFFFAINMTNPAISRLAFHSPVAMFDTSSLMVGQEDSIAKRLQENQNELQELIGPVIAKFAFLYHFKSVTVSAAATDKKNMKYYIINGRDSRDNLRKYHPELSSPWTSNQQRMQIPRVYRNSLLRTYPLAFEDSQVKAYFVINPNDNMEKEVEYLRSLFELKFSFAVLIFNITPSTAKYDSNVLFSHINASVSQNLLLVSFTTLLKVSELSHVSHSIIRLAWIEQTSKQNWMNSRFLGNFDVVLTPSSEVNEELSGRDLPIECSIACPSIRHAVTRFNIAAISNRVLPIDVIRVSSDTTTILSQLTNLFDQISIPINKRLVELPNRVNKVNLCICIRTLLRDLLSLALLVKSIVYQYSNLSDMHAISLDIYIINTDDFLDAPNDSFFRFIDRVTEEMDVAFDVRVLYAYDSLLDDMHIRDNSDGENRLYGYDYTDLLLEYLHKKSQSMSYDWILVTNGDNMYNSHWLETIAPLLSSPQLQLVAWDFISHHPRPVDKNLSDNSLILAENQRIRIKLVRRYVDLGSFFVRAQNYWDLLADEKQGSFFLDKGPFTMDVLSRDFHLIERLTSSLRTDAIELVHQCLMFHQ